MHEDYSDSGYSSCKRHEATTTATSHLVEWDEVTIHQREEGKLLYVYKCSAYGHSYTTIHHTQLM